MKITYPLSRWTFSIPELNFTDSVLVPHTWNTDERVMLHKGHAVYETTFTADAAMDDRRVFLSFNAVYHSARVFVNDMPAGEHRRSGYTPFKLDVTTRVKFGETNTVRVEVDNTHRDDMLPHGDDFDWADDGGIIRKVEVQFIPQEGFDHLHVTENIESMEDGRASGTLTLSTAFLDGCAHSARVTVMDYATYETAVDVTIPDLKDTFTIPFENLKLWSNKAPNLYVINVETAEDLFTTRIGIRKIEVSGTKVLLNGEPVYLRACEWMPGSHPDFGMAEPLSHSIKCLRQLKEAGCVFTRFHWQQDDTLFDWCDENGLMVQEEIPYWGFPKSSTALQLNIAKQQADEMVYYHYNHPSIICWGVGNELDAYKEPTIEYIKAIKAYIKAMDPRRLVNYVSNSLSRVECRPYDDGTLYGDIAMWNEYLTFWEPSDDVPEHIRITCRRAEGMPVFVSEFGLCEPFFKGGDPKRMEILNERLGEIYPTIDNLVGYMWFSLNDYRTHMGEEGSGRMTQRVHGSTDLYGNEKPSYRVFCELQKNFN